MSSGKLETQMFDGTCGMEAALQHVRRALVAAGFMLFNQAVVRYSSALASAMVIEDRTSAGKPCCSSRWGLLQNDGVPSGP